MAENDDDGGIERRALSYVLDRLEESVEGDGDSVSVAHIVEMLGGHSFPALILVPALLAVSPASGIPGVTVAVGLIVVVTVAQALMGRDCLWLPGFLANRRIPSDRLCGAVGWLRKPIEFVERFLRPRLTWLVRRPLVYLPLVVMMAIGMGMPLLELIPTSGSIAAATIALFATGLLMRDGLLILFAFGVVVVGPFFIWQMAT
jgi:hypothetical protein